tara:strand:- start:1914 stop:2699 length:786 start_codon:yes stop_codon:yes gene_type:complete
MDKITQVKKEIFNLKEELRTHPLYTKLHSVEDIRLFCEIHIFAVWDFMSLVKSLQNYLSIISVPWIPAKNPKLTRFINEIVLVEESDLDLNGYPKSHFEMYIEAMEQIGANTNPIKNLIQNIEMGISIPNAIESLIIQNKIKEFLKFTFEIIGTNQPHKIAAAFTFGREDIIPDMFIEIVKNIQNKINISLDKLIYYLNRHIEIDGDEHGPLALSLIESLCNNNEIKWNECIDIAKKSLKLRISLWDTVLHQLPKKNFIYE